MSKYLSTRLCIETNNNLQTAAATITTTSNASSSSKSGNDSINNIEFNLFVVNDSTTSTNASSSTTNGTSSASGGDLNYQLLTSNMTLEQIIEKYWKLNKPLELFYVSKTS